MTHARTPTRTLSGSELEDRARAGADAAKARQQASRRHAYAFLDTDPSVEQVNAEMVSMAQANYDVAGITMLAERRAELNGHVPAVDFFSPQVARVQSDGRVTAVPNPHFGKVRHVEAPRQAPHSASGSAGSTVRVFSSPEELAAHRAMKRLTADEMTRLAVS